MAIKKILSILMILSLSANYCYPISRTKTFNSTASGDGDLSKTASGFNAWPTAHGAASGTADDTGTTMRAYASFVFGFPNSRASIERAFIPIDLSGEPRGVRVDSGTTLMKLSIYVKTNGDNDGDDWINIVGITTQASNTSLTAGDYDNCGAVTNPTEHATRVDIGDITTGVYNDWTINSTGITEIEEKFGVGVINWGVREGHDAINSIPNSGATNQVTIFTSDSAGSSPRLNIKDYSYPQIM